MERRTKQLSGKGVRNPIKSSNNHVLGPSTTNGREESQERGSL